jgi:hypothetical protein
LCQELTEVCWAEHSELLPAMGEHDYAHYQPHNEQGGIGELGW